jgi:hypothetical protein
VTPLFREGINYHGRPSAVDLGVVAENRILCDLMLRLVTSAGYNATNMPSLFVATSQAAERPTPPDALTFKRPREVMRE